MENIRFLTEILMSEHEYWVVAFKNEYQSLGETKRGDDHIMFISIPHSIRRGLKREEITLVDLEKIEHAEIDNISLSEKYTPFQIGISMYNAWAGFPVEKGIKQFLAKAIQVVSTSLHEYKKLLPIYEIIQDPSLAPN